MAPLTTRSSLANGDGRDLSLIVILHVGATMGRRLTVRPHLIRFLKLLVTGVLIAQRGFLRPPSPMVLQDARTHRPLPRRARRTKKRRGLSAVNSSRVKMRERGVNSVLARSERAATCHLRLASRIHLRIVTGGAGHERLAVAHLVCQ